MFIFYYAVLSEVSPPTALSPFAAAALTGGNPYKTTMMAWKYTLPAFIVPFMFTLHPDGVGLLLVGSWPKILWTSFTSMIGIAALAGGVDAWFLKRANWPERILLMTGGLMLVYSSWLYDAIGLGLVIAVVVLQKTRPDPAPA
jgi:TRAP-type uncharacterized transport system fused permease subunit